MLQSTGGHDLDEAGGHVARIAATAESGMSWPAPRSPAPMMRTASRAHRRPFLEAGGECQHVLIPESGLEFRQSAPPSEPAGTVCRRLGVDFAAMLIGQQ